VKNLIDEWSTALMNMRKTIPVLLVLLASAHENSSAQTLGQFGGAGAAADGEGSVFMLAGNEAFRTGLSTRFNISRVSDFGIQVGLDRACSESFFGGGIDFKIVLLESAPELPLSLALDASFGNLTSDAVGRFLFGFGILASGVIRVRSSPTIEPYLSFVVDIEQIDQKRATEATAGCLCSGTDDETETDTLVRAGVKIPVSSESQILVEASFDGTTLVGAAFNIVF